MKIVYRAAILVSMVASVVTMFTVFTSPAKSDQPYPVNHAFQGASVSDSIFNYHEIPVNTKVPLERMSFDQGGYQLYDKAGETIIVPFDDNNLYVMRFARTDEYESYFVNADGIPTLYVRRGDYLENAAVSGAKWYPFSERFHPSTPVFLGIAPSWHDFVVMGWYPHMEIRAGYWSPHPFMVGTVYTPALAFSITIGGTPYLGWDRYHNYVHVHPMIENHLVINNVAFSWGGHAFSYDHHDFVYGHHDWDHHDSFADHGRHSADDHRGDSRDDRGRAGNRGDHGDHGGH